MIFVLSDYTNQNWVKLFSRVEKSGGEGSEPEWCPKPSCSTAASLYLLQRQNAAYSWQELHFQESYPYIKEYRRKYKPKLEETISKILFQTYSWDQKVNFRFPAFLVLRIRWMMPLFSRARFGKYTNPCYNLTLQRSFTMGIMVLAEDYSAPVSLTFVPRRGSANTGDINPQRCLVTPVETELGSKEKEGKRWWRIKNRSRNWEAFFPPSTTSTNKAKQKMHGENQYESVKRKNTLETYTGRCRNALAFILKSCKKLHFSLKYWESLDETRLI